MPSDRAAGYRVVSTSATDAFRRQTGSVSAALQRVLDRAEAGDRVHARKAQCDVATWVVCPPQTMGVH